MFMSMHECIGLIERLSKKDLFKFVQLTYGFEEPLEIIVIGRKKDN